MNFDIKCATSVFRHITYLLCTCLDRFRLFFTSPINDFISEIIMLDQLYGIGNFLLANVINNYIKPCSKIKEK